MTADFIGAFRAVLHDAGLCPDQIAADGALHRCGTVGKEHGKDGAYVLHPDTPPSGWWKNYRTGESATWTAGNPQTFSAAMRASLQARKEADKMAHQREDELRHSKAQNLANHIFSHVRSAPSDHPYLVNKGIKPSGNIRVTSDNKLVIPLQDERNILWSLQFISNAGGKRFLAGGKVQGCFFPLHGEDGPLYIAEGYATGATIHSATGNTTLVALDCGNLQAVAKTARQHYPDRSIILCADDDHATAATTGHNPGIDKATEAALAINGLLAVPVFRDPIGKTDFNDLATAEGLTAVKKYLHEAKPASAPHVSQGGGLAPVPFEDTAPPAIPPENVPGILRDFPLALAESLQVPFELALCNALGTVAVAVQRKVQVLVKEDYTEPLNIYALCPLPPGERKSATVEQCKRPLVEWQIANTQAMRELIRDAKSEQKTLEKTLDAKRTLAAKAKSDAIRQEIINEIKVLERSIPEVPVPPRLLADDFTPEALGMLMERQEQRIGVLEAEGGLFDTLAGKYSNGIPNLDAVLKFWSGESCQIDRRGRDALFLDDPHLTLVISPQPEVVQGLASRPGFRGRGLIGRFLYILPQSRLGKRSVETEPVSPALVRAWRDTIFSLLELPWARDAHGEITPYNLQLEKGAYQQWQNYTASLEKELGAGGLFEHMTDWAGKFPGQVIRLAGLIHMAADFDPLQNPISTITMQDTLDVANVLLEHAKAAFGLMGSDPAQDCAKAILRWIKRDRLERFTARDALEKVKGRFPTMEKVHAGLAILEERAFIFEAVTEQRSGPGRKPSTTYAVNSLL